MGGGIVAKLRELQDFGGLEELKIATRKMRMNNEEVGPIFIDKRNPDNAGVK
jgi:hypothetical protein